MPGDRRTPGRRADERADPASPTRRKFLVTGAFTVASAVALRGLPRLTSSRSTAGDQPASPTADHPGGSDGQPGSDHRYDVVIENGRVIDPESGLDTTTSVGIDDGTITGLGDDVRSADTVIDAAGLVVAPGFIDVLSYEPDPDGSWYKIADGVTTNLGMHGMQQGWRAAEFFDEYRGRTPVNYGGAFSDHWVRFHELGLDVGQTATPAQIDRLGELLEAQLHDGWLGVAFEPEYTPGVDLDEMVALAEVAAAHQVPCFIHGRFSSHDRERDTVPEAIEIAKRSGAAVHIAHLPSTGGTWRIDEALAEIDEAIDEGHDITFDLYPYDFWATFAGSTRFADGWQERFQIDYGDLQVAGSDQRLTPATFATAKQNNSLTVAYAIPTDSVRRALEHPAGMIGSDAIVDTGNNHPRASGTFCRVLGHWVRDEQALSLTEALAKMTIQPARRLEKRCPALTRKGRIRQGADADICIFDPDMVTDRATVAEPVAHSTGIEWVLVGGEVVKGPGGLEQDRLVGQPVKSVLT